MNKLNCETFDAAEWMALAESAPEAFERKRREAIEKLISHAPSRLHKHLNCLQWRIDMERRKGSTPLAACIRLNRMMWDFVHAENGLLGALNMLAAPPSHAGVQTDKFAKILLFPPPGS